MTNPDQEAFYFPDTSTYSETFVDLNKGQDKYGFTLPYPSTDLNQFKAFISVYNKKLEFRAKQWGQLMSSNGNYPPDRSDKDTLERGYHVAYVESGAENNWSNNMSQYRQLITKLINNEVETPFLGEIEQDMHRTFPNNLHFKLMEQDISGSNRFSAQIPKIPILSALRRVLLCFTLYKPDVGYLQPFSYIVGLLLLFMDEEKAFWMLVTIATQIVPENFYKHQLQGAALEVKVLTQLIATKLPALNSHFNEMEKAGMPSPLLAFSPWFPLLFVDQLPPESALRVLDSFFYEGIKILFRTSLALLILNERDLIATKDPMQLFQKLQNLPRVSHDCQKLMEVAFSRTCTISRSDLQGIRDNFGNDN